MKFHKLFNDFYIIFNFFFFSNFFNQKLKFFIIIFIVHNFLKYFFIKITALTVKSFKTRNFKIRSNRLFKNSVCKTVNCVNSNIFFIFQHFKINILQFFFIKIIFTQIINFFQIFFQLNSFTFFKSDLIQKIKNPLFYFRSCLFCKSYDNNIFKVDIF